MKMERKGSTRRRRNPNTSTRSGSTVTRTAAVAVRKRAVSHTSDLAGTTTDHRIHLPTDIMMIYNHFTFLRNLDGISQ